MTSDHDPSNQARLSPDGESQRRRGRGPFDYGELRLIALEMMAEQPRHGYELIKMIEERMGGGYSPSPGVIYPTLSWLEDAGYATPKVEGGRKRFRATPEGEAYLAANRVALSEIAVHMGAISRRGDPPEPVLRGMDEIKHALRTRFAHGPVDEATIARIAATPSAAAAEVRATMAGAAVPGTTLRSVADVATRGARDYLGQLCAHFTRRASVRCEGDRGEVIFSIGTCRFAADAATLTLVAEAADVEALGRVEDVVERHLARFAVTEKLAIDWKRG